MFNIDITDDAIEDMRMFREFDRRRIFDGIEAHLSRQPAVTTRNRKPLRANPLAEWELRLDPFRVFYSVDTINAIVTVIAVGKKQSERLLIRGVEYKL